MYFRFIKVNFLFTNGEGKRRKLSFPSTVDNFRDTFRSPRYSFTASYDAKTRVSNNKVFNHKPCQITRSPIRFPITIKVWNDKALRKKFAWLASSIWFLLVNEFCHWLRFVEWFPCIVELCCNRVAWVVQFPGLITLSSEFLTQF